VADVGVTRRLVSIGLPSMLFGVALAVRVAQHHAALLYPDGYQYLLMARGIAEHLQPTTILGPGGDAFVPSPDAGVKPLFPLVVAVVHAFGMSWLSAAEVVTVVAGAWAVTAVALLVAKLSGSQLAGLAAGGLVLASPSLGFWLGFSGPDPLAVALVVSTALAFAHRRATLGGVLTGLAIAARPEIAVIALAAAVVSLRGTHSRAQLSRAVPSAALTVTLTYVLLRVPVSVTDWRLAWLLPILVAGLGLVLVAPVRWLPHFALASLGVVVLAVVLRPGPATVWHEEWPLLLVGGAGLLVLVRQRRPETAGLVMAVVLLLGSIYLVKNPTLERYFALLLPAAAILAGLGLAVLSGPARALAVVPIALAAGIGLLHPVPGSRDYDMFPMIAHRIAARLEPTPEPLVTAAPDAYGFWLTDRPVHRMRRGIRGAILLDAAQRLYAPKLSAKGRVVARVSDGIAFARPDLEIDAAPAVLVAGEVVPAGHLVP
jgi:hypothetical protein